MARDEPEEGDKVSWNWGGGAPGGTVAQKKTEGAVEMTSRRGNKVKKNAEPNDPAVYVERSGHDVVKKASELNVEKKAKGGQKRKAKEEPEEEEEPHEMNEEGKEVKLGGKERNKAEMEEKETDENESVKPNDGKKRDAVQSKKSKKSSSSGRAEKKPQTGDSVSSRTRSKR